MNSSIFVLFLLAQLSLSTFVSKGIGWCASVTPVVNQGGYYSSTVISGAVINRTICEQYCQNANNPSCIGYSWDPASSAVSCRLHGYHEHADFTNWLSTNTNLTNGTYSFANTGASSDPVMVENSGYQSGGSNYTCYQNLHPGGVVGDPYLTSVFGCQFKVPLVNKGEDEQIATLMDCGNEKLIMHFKQSMNQHITRIDIFRGGEREKFVWKTLKRPQETTVCGNLLNFHRYYAGINLRIPNAANFDFTGLLADKRCL